MIPAVKENLLGGLSSASPPRSWRGCVASITGKTPYIGGYHIID